MTGTPTMVRSRIAYRKKSPSWLTAVAPCQEILMPLSADCGPSQSVWKENINTCNLRGNKATNNWLMHILMRLIDLLHDVCHVYEGQEEKMLTSAYIHHADCVWFTVVSTC
ncbi:unnamed protein product [Ectocarpus sp. 13 AM-2016]